MVQLLAQNNCDKTPVGPPRSDAKTPTISATDNSNPKRPSSTSPVNLAGLGGGLGADLGVTLKPGDRRLSVLSNYAQRRSSIMSTGKFQAIRE